MRKIEICNAFKERLEILDDTNVIIPIFIQIITLIQIHLKINKKTRKNGNKCDKR
jgi:hypothetical protein